MILKNCRAQLTLDVWKNGNVANLNIQMQVALDGKNSLLCSCDIDWNFRFRRENELTTTSHFATNEFKSYVAELVKEAKDFQPRAAQHRVLFVIVIEDGEMYLEENHLRLYDSTLVLGEVTVIPK